jgi:fatty acid desaturase
MDKLETEVIKKYKQKSYASLYVNTAIAPLAYILVVVLGIKSQIPDVLLIPVITYLFVMMFAIGHESVHKHFPNKVVNELVGTIFGFVTLIGFHITRNSHMPHHMYTNKRPLDTESVHPKLPTFFLTIYTLLGIPFKWFSVIMSLFPRASKKVRALRNPPILGKDRHNNVSSKWTFITEMIIIVMSFVFGFTYELVIFWLIPGSLTMMVVGLFFIHFPHRNLPNDDRFVSVKNLIKNKPWIEKSLKWSIVFNGLNYHGTHHAYPSVMAMHLPGVTKELNVVMKQKGLNNLN